MHPIATSDYIDLHMTYNNNNYYYYELNNYIIMSSLSCYNVVTYLTVLIMILIYNILINIIINNIIIIIHTYLYYIYGHSNLHSCVWSSARTSFHRSYNWGNCGTIVWHNVCVNTNFIQRRAHQSYEPRQTIVSYSHTVHVHCLLS